MRRYDLLSHQAARQLRHGANHFATEPFIDMNTISGGVSLGLRPKVDSCLTLNISSSVHFRPASRAPRGRHDHQRFAIRGRVLVGTLQYVIANQGPFFAPLRRHCWRKTTAAPSAQHTDIAKREVTSWDKSTPYSVLRKSCDLQQAE